MFYLKWTSVFAWEKAWEILYIGGLVGIKCSTNTRILTVSAIQVVFITKLPVMLSRLLLSPVRVGAQAFSWATGKLENNRLGLPTSPSSSDVQNRVLQAAAKHGSQPSETEVQNPSPDAIK
ncbi:RHODANESE/CELL CYCLE CONTROL PHOSPHATASE SUPERFAMILY PROTEIN [Salix koriyanagi]|uniref:RHODANESE/CELL CYCLE CONTROL PHOSPHATASE SUPERFAMILY PROTEIN n=1 Tax=Salix koriyanagi TaxID=2511006 RepID=A0A9Q0W0D6_9ROSI|nr:RHODANESE/CELL CYCLE CONTROL PHOSPHATASE SUPERFAMILY PROTEIN [Salix koriyanagi]